MTNPLFNGLRALLGLPRPPEGANPPGSGDPAAREGQGGGAVVDPLVMMAADCGDCGDAGGGDGGCGGGCGGCGS